MDRSAGDSQSAGGSDRVYQCVIMAWLEAPNGCWKMSALGLESECGGGGYVVRWVSTFVRARERHRQKQGCSQSWFACRFGGNHCG